MRKHIILTGLFVFVALSLCGCQKKYYGKGQAFTMKMAESAAGYSNADIAARSADNYERFMHASYIIATDKYGEEHKIKISANIKRNDWDFANLQTDGSFKNYVEADGSDKKVGIDVSEHQGVIDWAAVATQVDFAVIRLGYRGYTSGGMALDAYYSANIAGATEAGIPVGVYFYSQATSYEEGVEEANFVLNNLGDYGLAYPVVLDREDPMADDARTNDLTTEQHTQAVLGFLETIQESGHRAMIYTNRTYYALYLDLEKIYQYPVWFAQYADEPDWPYEFSIWQYTENGTVAGISGSVDLNLEMMPLQ